QNDSVTLWGWSQPAEKIFVTTSWNNQTDSTIVNNGARWKIKVKTPSAGGPYSITFKGNNTVELKDVMIGEVWVCSGQSNMEMNWQWGHLPDINEELSTCATNNIRFFHIPKTTSAYPQDNCSAKWEHCDSNSLKLFSAVGYFFGKKLNKELNVPVGLINVSWGGTPAEVWTEADAINNNAELKAASDKLEEYAWWPKKPGLTYNGMLAPLFNYSIAGAIWYQGEGNTEVPFTYSHLLTTMIDTWRKAWNKDLPFYYVQIAPFTYGTTNQGNIIREQQTKALRHDNVGMAVITDLVDDTTDIHPKYKHEVGYRLAGWALAETYHKTGFTYKSPLYKNIEIKKDKAIISFDNAPTGLISKDKKINALQIAGDDKVFYPADAKIEGDKLIVSNKKVKQPVAVRFSYSNAAVGNLFSKEGLPVCPFRTDDWEVEMVPVKK
ncbi:MAG: sialate O-acetylesterase, partial [Bacteroidetes bacterium]|nr:sialate O-acetylesterase [Bacteroidota bacterium]